MGPLQTYHWFMLKSLAVYAGVQDGAYFDRNESNIEGLVSFFEFPENLVLES